MSSDIWFPIAGLFFSILTIILIVTKSHINSKEINIFKKLLIANFFGLILEILCTYASYIHESNVFLSDFILKFYLVYNVIWVLILTYYTFTIASSYVTEETYKKFINPIFYVIGAISSIMCLVLPIELILSDDFRIRYTQGPSVDFCYIICGIFIAYMFVLVIKDIKHLKNQKYIPIFAFLIVGLIGMGIQFIQPGILILTFIETFISVLMYHTIENPDVKMLEDMTVAKEQADRANHAKSDFLSSMSHEIRTPLNAIVGLSEDIQELEGLPDGAREDAKDIVMASQTLLEIVGNILDISKIESDKIEITESEYHPREIIENLARIDAVRIGDKPIDFKLHLAADLPYELIGDKVHVKQIINNLISNSIKYTNEGEINLTINCINKGDNCDLIITCQDTGIGIKEEYISKLFGKFERLGVEKNTTVEGTGLGLAITKKLIEMMGGKINVQSTYGKGSLFVVFLPQKISKLIDTQKVNTDGPIIIPKVVPEVDYSTKRILVVDDNALNIKVARKSLAPLNCNIDEATTGMKCIEKVKNGEKYDVILLDIMMPGLSGSETLKELKNIPGFSIPVIALTADAIQGAKEKYISEGFNDYIAKPFSKEQIKEKLDLIFK